MRARGRPPCSRGDGRTRGRPGDAGGGGAAGASIAGKITLAPERKADVTPNDVVYLVARRISDNPSARGSLVAVKRFSASARSPSISAWALPT